VAGNQSDCDQTDLSQNILFTNIFMILVILIFVEKLFVIKLFCIYILFIFVYNLYLYIKSHKNNSTKIQLDLNGIDVTAIFIEKIEIRFLIKVIDLS